VVLLGCCALLADGAAVTSAAGAALAREASARGIPVHVMADTLKLAPWLPEGAAQDLALERVPPEQIVKVVTEDGIRQPRQLQAEAADLSRRWRGLEDRSGDGLLA
jgi:translation initiation factor 2B subunit (eIF-2B alpha/beta/delta family)